MLQVGKEQRWGDTLIIQRREETKGFPAWGCSLGAGRNAGLNALCPEIPYIIVSSDIQIKSRLCSVFADAHMGHKSRFL